LSIQEYSKDKAENSLQIDSQSFLYQIDNSILQSGGALNEIMSVNHSADVVAAVCDTNKYNEAKYISHYLPIGSLTSRKMDLKRFHTIREKLFDDVKNESIQNTETAVRFSRSNKMKHSSITYQSESALLGQNQTPSWDDTESTSLTSRQIDDESSLETLANDQCDRQEIIIRNRFRQWATASIYRMNSKLERIKRKKHRFFSYPDTFDGCSTKERMVSGGPFQQSDETQSLSTSASSSNMDGGKEGKLIQWEGKRLRNLIENILDGDVSVTNNNKSGVDCIEYCFHDNIMDGTFSDMFATNSTSLCDNRSYHSRKIHDIDDVVIQVRRYSDTSSRRISDAKLYVPSVKESPENDSDTARNLRITL
jgi:hypothetical protein